MKLENAKQLADILLSKMSEYSERVEIAGSIRRGKPEVKDIEIVALPKWSNEIPPDLQTAATVQKPAKKPEFDSSPIGKPGQWELFGTADDEKPYIPPAFSSNELNLLFLWGNRQPLIRWIKPGVNEPVTWRILPDGKYWRGIIENDSHLPIKLDLFLTRTDNWGVIQTIRTGPADFSAALVAFIKRETPFHVKDGFLRNAAGEPIPCREEKDFFTNCGLRFVPVEQRDAVNPYSLFYIEK